MKLFILIILFFQLFLSTSTVAGRQEDGGIKALEERLSVERERLEASRVRERDLVADIEALDKELKLKKTQIFKVKERIRENREEHRAIAGRLERIEKEAASRKMAVSEKLAVFYKHARGGYARILFEVQEIDLFRRAVKYAAGMIEEDLKVLENHAAAVRKYEKEKSRLEEDLFRKEEFLASEEKTLAVLEESLQEIVLKLVNIQKEKEFYETAIKELKLASEEFKNTISAIEKRTTGESASEFSEGDLIEAIPLPADGDVIKPSAAVPGEDRSGIFIDVQPGAEVRAVLSGKVEFSGPVKGYGRTVIINHGRMLYSISSYLEKCNVGEGKTVQAGDTVGTAGERAGKGIVYFEIRYAGRPLDVRIWLSAD